MNVQCDKCLRHYDDAQCWTTCPHGPLWAGVNDYCPACDTVESFHGPCQHQRGKTMQEERMMKWFDFEHLPEHLKVVSANFYEAACEIVALIEPGPERTVALRKLLESKDAAVRATVHPGG